MLQSQEEGPYFYKQCLLRQKQSGGGRQIASGFLGSKGLHKRCFQKPFTLWKVQIGKKCKSANNIYRRVGHDNGADFSVRVSAKSPRSVCAPSTHTATVRGYSLGEIVLTQSVCNSIREESCSPQKPGLPVLERH